MVLNESGRAASPKLSMGSLTFGFPMNRLSVFFYIPPTTSLLLEKRKKAFRIILRQSKERDNDCRRLARWVVLIYCFALFISFSGRWTVATCDWRVATYDDNILSNSPISAFDLYRLLIVPSYNRCLYSSSTTEMAGFTSSQSRKGNLYKEMAELTVSKPKQQWELEGPIRNWLELPYDVVANILYRIGPIDILENAQKVCTTWCKICKDPAMWRVIHMKTTVGPFRQVWEICRHAVDRSQGQLVDISIVEVVNDQLLQYVAHRSSQLKRLEFVSHNCDIRWNWTQALKKFPMLEELNLYRIQISTEAIETAGRCCPMLKTLKVNQESCMFWHGGTDEKSLMIRNRTAKAIGENLHDLRHLELIGNTMTDIGLQAILDGCHRLESLDLRLCLYINLKGDMGKKCSEKNGVIDLSYCRF
ncbi:unnamed protein product [Lactuca virosa]|uniref:F-box domain-containing protein n=1 Tax=Lactuca virosa TaxID=75947 RepID=A0AAU9MFX9_9ASTR|nr:unnamed protein product [Lactuca virosa]